MATLGDLISCGLIKVEDSVEFTFKGNHFISKIFKGGILSKCKVKRSGTDKYEDVLKNVISFSSLTAWTEACLQEVLEEYYTRYSSWKRVTHHETKQSMGEIRDRYKLMNTDKRCESVELYKEIRRLEVIVNEMIECIKSNSGEIDRRWTVLPVTIVEKNRPVQKKRKLNNPEAFYKVQEMLLRS
jgi:hypothetical protein